MEYGLSSTIPTSDSRQELWKQQREERGFDSTELWNLDSTIAKFITPRLKAYAQGELHNVEWSNTLSKMIIAFDLLSSGEMVFMMDADKQASITEGLQLFADNYCSLWN